MKINVSNVMPWMSLVAMLFQVAMARSQQPNAKGRDPDRPSVTFSIDDHNAIIHVRQLREVAIMESIGVLDRRREGASVDSGDYQATDAARLLGHLRCDDAVSIAALLGNLSLRPRVSISPAPLNGHVAAEALSVIGGHKVATAVLNHLKRPQSHLELLLCAHILHRNDSNNITLERIRLTTEDSLKTDSSDVHAQFLYNITQVREWLADPTFRKNKRYIPE